MLSYDKKLNPQHSLSLSGKLFYNYIENRIVLAEFSSLQFNYQNLSEFQTHGLNLRAAYNWGDDLSLNSGFALTRLYNFWSEDFDTQAFTSLPELQNELSIEIPYIAVNLNIVHRYIGKQIRFYQGENDVLEQGFIGDFHLLNASLSRSYWKDRIFLALGAKNLTNTRSVANTVPGGGVHSGSSGSQLINWGRTWFVRLHLRFSRF